MDSSQQERAFRRLPSRALLTTLAAAALLALTLLLLVPGAARASGVETGPQGIAVDDSGDVYVSDWARNTIDEITPHGSSIVAGIPGRYGSPTPGRATDSTLNYPIGLAMSEAGDLYIVDFDNCVVEKVTRAGALSIVAGTVGQCGTPTPGPATSSMLASPIGVAVDPNGNLYIADQGAEHGANNVIEKVTPSGTLSIFAGELGASGAPTPGPATDSMLSYPQAVAVDSAGDVYIADSLNGVVEKVNAAGILSIYAGEVGAGSGFPTPGPATDSRLNSPGGVATDTAGDVYVTDSGNNMIEKVDTADQLTIFAGEIEASGAPTPGPATDSMLNQPVDAAVDSGGNVYIADTGNDLAEEVTPAGDLSIIWNATDPISGPQSVSTLTVSFAGTGSGTVSGQGLRCPNTCSESYPEGDQVTLSATPTAGSEFAGWSGGGCTGTGTCTITMNSDQNVTATFTAASAAASTAAVQAPPPPLGGVRAPNLSSFGVWPHRATWLTRRIVAGRCVALTRSDSHERSCGGPLRLKISYALNTPARITIRISRTASGRMVGGRCIKADARNRHYRRCTRWVAIPGALVENGNQGANRLTFNGWIGGARLTAGTYRLSATPTANEQTGAPRRATLTIS